MSFLFLFTFSRHIRYLKNLSTIIFQTYLVALEVLASKSLWKSLLWTGLNMVEQTWWVSTQSKHFRTKVQLIKFNDTVQPPLFTRLLTLCTYLLSFNRYHQCTTCWWRLCLILPTVKHNWFLFSFNRDCVHGIDLCTFENVPMFRIH